MSLLPLALLCLLHYPICPTRGTFLKMTNHPNGSISSPSSVFELNPDEMTQPFLFWQNSSSIQQKNNLPKGSTNICRCLNCTHMTQQRTLIRFSSIGTVNPQTGVCHLLIFLRPGEPIEEVSRQEYQILGNPFKLEHSWVEPGSAPENSTLLISKLNDRKVYNARFNLGNGLMAFASVNPKLPERHIVSTRNASFIQSVQVLSFRLTREQIFFMETPPSELNPDEIEYRLKLKDEPNSELDLSCKGNFTQWEKSEPQNETIFLELYRKDPFPFEWMDRYDIFPSYWSKRPLPFYLNGSRGLFYICRSTASNGDTLYGMVDLSRSSDRRTDSCPPPCTVYQGGHQWKVVSTYEVLANPAKLKVTWEDAPNLRELPSSAYITSPVEACNRNGRATEKRYIGRLVSAGITAAIFNFPDGFKDEESVPNVGASPFGRHVKLNESSLRQVLVGAPTHAPSSEELITGLVCVKTSKHLDLSTFHEDVKSTVKIRLGNGGEMGEPRIQRIYQKIEPKQLVWITKPNLGYPSWVTQVGILFRRLPNLISPGGPTMRYNVYQTFICRYRCRGSNDCPSRHVTTVNGSTIVQTIDRTIGSFELSSNARRPCWVVFNGATYVTKDFDKLTNPCDVKINWTPVPLPNGTLAVVNESQGEKVFIGRIARPDGSYLIGQVAKRAIITFVNEGVEEAIVDEKVSILTVEA